MTHIYKHYKGEYYEVLYLGTHTETEEKLVVYKKHFEDDGNIWIRPFDMFTGKVEYNGEIVERFVRVI
jgi:hypothetical protein